MICWIFQPTPKTTLIMIFVTSATGTVGSQVINELMKQGVPFRAGVHKRPLEIEGVESHPINYNQPETLEPALK